jgi:polyhydroxyalkanoate synthesis regulator phasin
MFELIRKTILAGLGAATLTKEKVDKLVDELIKRGEVTAEERPKLVRDLLARAEESEKDLEGKVNESLEKVIEKLGIPTKADLDALSGKIDQLTKKVDTAKKTTAK